MCINIKIMRPTAYSRVQFPQSLYIQYQNMLVQSDWSLRVHYFSQRPLRHLEVFYGLLLIMPTVCDRKTVVYSNSGMHGGLIQKGETMGRILQRLVEQHTVLLQILRSFLGPSTVLSTFQVRRVRPSTFLFALVVSDLPVAQLSSSVACSVHCVSSQLIIMAQTGLRQVAQHYSKPVIGLVEESLSDFEILRPLVGSGALQPRAFGFQNPTDTLDSA